MDDGPDPVREASVPGTGALATQEITKVYTTPRRAAYRRCVAFGYYVMTLCPPAAATSKARLA
jgi:hypothetical protein